MPRIFGHTYINLSEHHFSNWIIPLVFAGIVIIIIIIVVSFILYKKKKERIES